MKDVINFLMALILFVFVIFLRLASVAFIIVILKWTLEIFIPDIGWKIPILLYVAGYFVRRIILRWKNKCLF
jgi:hypothetical protein